MRIRGDAPPERGLFAVLPYAERTHNDRLRADALRRVASHRRSAAPSESAAISLVSCRLLVVADATAEIAHFRDEAHLRARIRRSRLRELVTHFVYLAFFSSSFVEIGTE